MRRDKIPDNFDSPILDREEGNRGNNQKKQQQTQNQNINVPQLLAMQKRMLKDDEVALDKNFVKILLLANFIFCAVLFPYVVGWVDFTAEVWEIIGVTAAYAFIACVTFFVMKLTKTDLSSNT